MKYLTLRKSGINKSDSTSCTKCVRYFCSLLAASLSPVAKYGSWIDCWSHLSRAVRIISLLILIIVPVQLVMPYKIKWFIIQRSSLDIVLRGSRVTRRYLAVD